MSDISVIFITKNEEFHIGNAIDNVKDIAKDIFVVDSGSTDRTVEIAKGKGAMVLFHAFEGFGEQWNWALENCPVVTTWTMKMDPDERLSAELKESICAGLGTEGVAGFSFDRVLWFMGCRLKGVRGCEERIWRTGKCRFTNVKVNEHPLIAGPVKKLEGVMDHLDSVDLQVWLAKQNDYTTREAKIRFEHDALAVRPNLFGSALARRMWLKRLFYYIPCRYALFLLYCYFYLGAWRSGRVGFYWAQMRVFVMRLVELKWREMALAAKKGGVL